MLPQILGNQTAVTLVLFIYMALKCFLFMYMPLLSKLIEDVVTAFDFDPVHDLSYLLSTVSFAIYEHGHSLQIMLYMLSVLEFYTVHALT